jgi:hypothetical protein
MERSTAAVHFIWISRGPFHQEDKSMNGLNRYFTYVLVSFIIPAMIQGCTAQVPGQEGDEPGSGEGTLVIQVVGDAGVNIQEISVDLDSVEVLPADGDWTTFAEGVGTVYLVQGDASEQTIGDSAIAAQQFDAIGLDITGGTVIDGEGDSVDLDVPATDARLEIQTPFCVIEGETTTVKLDFNAEENIEDAGSTYTLVPAVVVQDGDSCSGA